MAAGNITDQGKSSESTGEQGLEWTAHPFRERPGRAAALLVVLAVVLVLVGLNFPEPGYVVLAGVFLFASVARFFFPTRYRFDDTEITVTFLGIVRRYRWLTYRRFEEGRNGLFLSPFPSPHRLDNFRGLFLLYGGRREAVAAFARRRLGERGDDAAPKDRPSAESG